MEIKQNFSQDELPKWLQKGEKNLGDYKVFGYIHDFPKIKAKSKIKQEQLSFNRKFTFAKESKT